mgnify:CR=1 FL=1
MKKAQELCDKQGGSVANVVTSTLKKYAEVENDETLSKDQKVLAIQKELEEATALELPMMEQNLPIIGTITTLGTLMGLLGTRYDPFICSFVCWWWYRLNGIIARYFRSVDQYSIWYLDRCIGGYCL